MLPAGWRSAPGSAAFTLDHPNETQHFPFQVTPGNIEQRRYRITAEAQTGTRTIREGYRSVTYPGLIPTNLYSPATYTVSMVDVKVAPGLKVAICQEPEIRCRRLWKILEFS